MEFESGEEIVEAVFEHMYVVGEIRAVNDEIEITLKEPDMPESTFF